MTLEKVYKTFQSRQKSKFLRKRCTNQSTYISLPSEHCREERSGWIRFKNNKKFELPPTKTSFEKWVP